ncbi:MAG: 30S ribosomal protein S6 [Anaerolineae bacterium]
MKRSYEIPVVFRVMPEEETQQAIDQVVAWIENSSEGVENAGSVTRIDRTRLGRRRLAYEIKGQRDGFYVLFYANVDALHLPEFELNMRLYDAVLRYLIVKEDDAHVEDVDEDDDVAATPEADETEASDEDDADEEENSSEESDD